MRKADEDDEAQATWQFSNTGTKQLVNGFGQPFRFGTRRYVFVDGAKVYRSYADYCD
jgi:hypothetical protein